MKRSIEMVDLVINSALSLGKEDQIEIYDALRRSLYNASDAPSLNTEHRTPNTSSPESSIKHQASNIIVCLAICLTLTAAWQPYIWPAIAAATEWVRSW